MRFALLYVFSMKLFFVTENTTLNAFWLFLWFSPVIVSFYQNNFEGSFDHSVRELEQLPQRFFCVTVWDTPPSVGSIEFHFPEICPRGNLTQPDSCVLSPGQNTFCPHSETLPPYIWIWYFYGSGLFYRNYFWIVSRWPTIRLGKTWQSWQTKLIIWLFNF